MLKYIESTKLANHIDEIEAAHGIYYVGAFYDIKALYNSISRHNRKRHCTCLHETSEHTFNRHATYALKVCGCGELDIIGPDTFLLMLIDGDVIAAN